MRAELGRSGAALLRHLVERDTVLVLGPLGIGKSTLLRTVQRRLEAEGWRVGRSEETTRLDHIVAALAAALPEEAAPVSPPVRRRARLRRAAARHPTALFLDHVGAVGTAAKSYLRSLRFQGVAIALAADAEHERDVAALYTRRLAPRVLQVPPMTAKEVGVLLDRAMADAGLPSEAWASQRGALIRLMRGRPGWVAMATQLLAQGDRVRPGPIPLSVLETALATLTTEHYLSGGRTLMPRHREARLVRWPGP